MTEKNIMHFCICVSYRLNASIFNMLIIQLINAYFLAERAVFDCYQCLLNCLQVK